MSVKFPKEEFVKKMNAIYDSPNIDIIDWRGYTMPITYHCHKCGKTHYNGDARNLISQRSYCDYEKRSAQRFSKEEFLYRLERLHERKIEVLSYSGLSAPLVYKCPTCGEVKTINPARGALHKFSLCNECDGVEKNIVRRKVETIFKDNPNYKLISFRGAEKKAKIQCLKCGALFERYPINIIQRPDVCPECNNGATKQKLDLNEIQKRLDEGFDKGEYTILEYRGQLNKHSKVRCNKCGLIFDVQMSYFITQTRGCPKCNRYESKGERLVEKYFNENNIRYERQKRFTDCNNNLSSFDFCVYGKNGQMILIEVNGRQHYENVAHWGGLELAQRRDSLKANYCKEHNIPLIIIPYNDLEMKKLDKYLEFLKGSTTISEESRE